MRGERRESTRRAEVAKYERKVKAGVQVPPKKLKSIIVNHNPPRSGGDEAVNGCRRSYAEAVVGTPTPSPLTPSVGGKI